MPKKIVTGDRRWSNTDVIAEEMATWPSDTVLIHGDAIGADTIADQCAELLGMARKPYPYMGEFGLAGGPIRNEKMLDDNIEDLEEVVAFHDDITSSKGTKHMVKYAIRCEVPVKLLTTKGEIPIPQELYPRRKKKS